MKSFVSFFKKHRNRIMIYPQTPTKNELSFLFRMDEIRG
jgi:hypothetical protein